jgi:hypothetical protein
MIEMVITAIPSTGARSLRPQGSLQKNKKFLERVIFRNHSGTVKELFVIKWDF